MAVLRWIISIPVVLAVIIFSAANIERVSVVWSPLHAPAEMPLAALCLIVFVAGFMAGGFMVWLNNGPLGRKSREKSREVNRLKKEQAQTANENAHRSTLPLLKDQRK